MGGFPKEIYKNTKKKGKGKLQGEQRGKAHLQEKESYSYLFLLRLFSLMTQYINTSKNNAAINIDVMMTGPSEHLQK